MRSKSARSLYMLSLGCPKNRVDSEVMAALLLQDGYRMVDDPAQVYIHGVQDIGGALLLNIDVAEGDVGKLIGKSGRTVGAVRVLLSAFAAKNGRRAMLEIVE